MSQPLISIIIPCYNNKKFIRTTVNSALNQDYAPKEVIVVNDGSEEDIRSELNDLISQGKIAYFEKQNGGASSARNFGIEMSRGKYILPLDSDDIILEDTASSLMEVNGDDENVIVSPWLTYFGDNNPSVWRPSPPTNQILHHNNTPSSSLYSKQLWSIIGGYDENMKKGYEDWEFWIRMYLAKAEFKVCPKHLFLYRRNIRTDRLSNIQEQHHTEIVKYILNKHEEKFYGNLSIKISDR
jgi:glycosyltransferase involved in cell wall biosynthesis